MPGFPFVFRISSFIPTPFNTGPLGNPCEMAQIIGCTYAPGHMPVLCQRVLQHIPYHGIIHFFPIFMGGQIIVNLGKSAFPIIVVRINYHKRSVHQFPAAADRMAGSPRFRPFFGHCKAFRDIRNILICIFNLHHLGNPITNYFLKILFVLLFYDKNNLFKACFHRIVQGEIHNNMPLIVHRVNLLQAPISAPHSCCHNY